MNIIITGASKGIGRALALEFSKRRVGNLYLISRSSQALREVCQCCQDINPENEFFAIPFNLDDLIYGKQLPLPSNIGIDILINNAGILVNKAFEDYTVEDLVQMTMTNLTAPALLIQTVLSRMGLSLKGHIVNIGSMGGFQGSVKFPGLSFYSATKSALASLTECLALELQSQNIAVNCLALGAVQTEMLSDAFPGYRAPLNAEEMAVFIADFALTGSHYFNGKVLPVSITTP